MSDVAQQTSSGADMAPRFEGGRGEARHRVIVELLGEPQQTSGVLGFVQALRRETARDWERHVEPLIELHWPQVRSTPFYAKFKIGAQQVYAPAPYTVMLLSRRRPVMLRLLLGLCAGLHLGGAFIARALCLLVPLYARLFMTVESRRIALMAAFIAAVDEAFDHHLEHLPAVERPGVLRAILEGTAEPSSPPLKLVQALRMAMNEGTSVEEAAELSQAIEGCCRWGEAEMRRALRQHDTEGLCHRGEGIRNGINGLAWTVRRYISEVEWQWMFDVSCFIQMLDDWVDLEKDLADDVWTPVADGIWNLDTIRDSFERTSRTVVDIARAHGEPYDPYLSLIEEGYREQVRDLLQNMVRGVAA
ncbi:MAG: hypothetical protein ABIJ09_01325 [Pseudomonadota bacterium]